jgi:hypothetical protein
MADLEVFVDDSGDCETCLSFTALVMPSGMSTAAKDIISEYIEPLFDVLRLGSDFELHGTELLREGSLKDYQREFLYRHCLETIADFPELTVVTVHWDWSPAPYRVSGQPAAWRHRLLWARLLNELEKVALGQYPQSHEITSMIVDESTNQGRLREEHEAFVRTHSGTRILSVPEFEASEDNRLLQVADLCAFAADLHARPYAEKDTRTAKPSWPSPVHTLGWDWYPRILSSCFPYFLPGSGIRRLSGHDAT